MFIIKLYFHNDIFKHIGMKHGKDVYNIIRSFETLKTKYQKVVLDLIFIKTYRKEDLIPTFADFFIIENSTTYSCTSLIQIKMLRNYE